MGQGQRRRRSLPPHSGGTESPRTPAVRVRESFGAGELDRVPAWHCTHRAGREDALHDRSAIRLLQRQLGCALESRTNCKLAAPMCRVCVVIKE